jgi:hypothetical protein
LWLLCTRFSSVCARLRLQKLTDARPNITNNFLARDGSQSNSSSKSFFPGMFSY